MPRPSRRDFCLTGAVALTCGCSSATQHGDGGTDMSTGRLVDIAGFYQQPDFACGNQPVGGPSTSFVVSDATFFRCARLFVCRDASGIYAMTSICTHQQCDIDFDKTQPSFTCPCHLSQFDFNGNVTVGPAVLPLSHLAVTLDSSGNIVVNPFTIVDPATRLSVPGD
jgi:Rieske Fe-S protein